ncbi:hypothetical protein P9112_000476 [Eukaryota sp. TZLM1-RC]
MLPVVSRTFISGCLSTFLGGILACRFGHKLSSRTLAFSFSVTSGIMLHIGIFDLFLNSYLSIGPIPSHLAFFIGILLFSLILFIVPSPSLPNSNNPKLLRSGFVVFLSISLHNLPEGLVVGLPNSSSTTMAAIILHNVIEGLVMSIPLKSAKVSTFKVLLFAFLSGLSETIGGCLLLFLSPSTFLLELLNAGLGGIMTLTSLLLLPDAFVRVKGEVVVTFVVIGMILSSVLYCFGG